MTDFVRPTRSDLITNARNDINARVTGADSRLRRSFLSAIAAMHAGGLDGAYGTLSWIADQVMPDSADSVHLARWASFWGIFPKVATPAAGTATGVCTGDADIPLGTVLQRADGFDYATTADTVVVPGAISIPVAASAPGSAGSAASGVILTLVSPIVGVDPAFTVAADMSGADAETDPELLGRLEARIQNPPKGGGPGDYVAWAEQMAGVTRAWEYPLLMGLGTVGVAFVFDDRVDIFPLVGDVSAMQAWLDGLAPITAAVTAFAPTSLAVPFDIAVTPNTAGVQAAVEAELAALFQREAAPGTVLLLSHIAQTIGESAGVTDYVLTTPSANVAPAAGELPVPGSFTWL
jgi:uncharacterized phage protein gp47/JayE